MATTVSAWAKPGAWALDSEENEAMEAAEQELRQQQQQQQQPLSDFPSLATAASAKPKKKKGQHFSLAEFNTGKQVTHGAAKIRSSAFESKGLTSDELLILPTGPRERTSEELERGRHGGGFRNYGDGRENGSGRFEGGFGGRRENLDGEEGNGRWGSSRATSRVPDAPSRADETDDWGAGKKSAAAMGGFDRRGRGEEKGFFDSQSRADDSDNWSSNKSFVPPESRRSGLGFENYKERESRFGNRSGFEMFQKDVNGGRPGSDSWTRKGDEGSGRPRLVLQPRTLPVTDGEQQQGMAKSKGSSPFGEARPREEVLAEKGQDWKKIDEQLESMKIKEVGSSGPGSERSDGSFGRRAFGSGNGRASLPEDRIEKSWRKTDSSEPSLSMYPMMLIASKLAPNSAEEANGGAAES